MSESSGNVRWCWKAAVPFMLGFLTIRAFQMSDMILMDMKANQKILDEMMTRYVAQPPQQLKEYGSIIANSINEEGDSMSKNFVSRKPVAGEKTLGMFGHLKWGFRNEAMAFQAFILYAETNNFTQVLLPSVKWLDWFGTNGKVQHEQLFDVEYWNSFYPTLPRFVDYDNNLFPDFDNEAGDFRDCRTAETLARNPYAYGRYLRLYFHYIHYTREVVEGKRKPSPAVLAIQRALRPHPEMLEIINRMSKEDDQGSWMALHARVEPDMQKHKRCRGKKVLRLQDIFDSVETKFPRPLANTLFIAINRPMLEKEVKLAKSANDIAVENLDVLNRARKEGLWNGTVVVREAGMASVKNSSFSRFPGISGAMMDYFLAMQSTVFIGTEVSSFSVELINNRFYSGNYMNYHYRPDGLHRATLETDKAPPMFYC